jgi:hypothetical protein
MSRLRTFRRLLTVVSLGFLLLPQLASAQTYFKYSGYGDLLLGFRKTGAHQGTYELVVNTGNVTNLIGLAPGATVSIGNYTQARLTSAFPDGNGDLQWSLFSTFQLTAPWVTPVGTFAKTTLWLSYPSPATNVQSTPFPRTGFGAQAFTRQNIIGVGSGANTISSGLATTNADNNTVLVREPLNGVYTGYTLTDFIGDSGDTTIGDFNNFNVVVENTTPHTFTSAQRSDFYQSVPSSFVDPITGATNGNAYFVGYFLFNPNGTITFTRASAAAPAPPPPVLSIQRSGNTSTISFGTTNGATYTLYYTNTVGLTAPIANWKSSPTTVTGNGNPSSFMDITTDSNRVYRVGAH